MKIAIILFYLINILNSSSKITFSEEQLCEHITDGSGKSKGVKVNLLLPCDWKEMESKSPDEIFKFIKKNDETKVTISAILNITDLPAGLIPSDKKDLLKPEGLKALSDGSGEIESSKPLTIDNLKGGQIIRKDAVRNYYKIYNYFLYKGRMVTISYYVVSTSQVNVKDYFDVFDSFLKATKFN